VSSNQETFVVEAMRRPVRRDPTLSIYDVTVKRRLGAKNHSLWLKRFGSLEQLQAYLDGLTTTLVMEGYFATGLDWLVPEGGWMGGSVGLRWTVDRKEPMRVESLDGRRRVVRRN
jgi:hypothetical protein